jgi:RimJ/RimL family protein N-acetyltransferase
MFMIQGKNVYLRIVTRSDLALMEAWEHDRHFLSEFDIFDLVPAETIERGFAGHSFLTTQYGRLLVVTQRDEVAGFVSYHHQRYGPNEASTAYNIGIGLHADYRGKGYGSEAQKLLAAYLFDTYPIMRVEASTDRENLPEQKALEKAGFTRDGILRGAQWRGGQWHDLVLYSKLRGE